VQTQKVTSFPIVLMGTDYWGGLLDWLKASALDHGTISEKDLRLLHVTDDLDEAVRTIVTSDRRIASEQKAAEEQAAVEQKAADEQAASS
jgi:predicted Rossmann-fold nucleotide-binding protein